MDPLIWLAFFVGGWVLSGLNSYAKMKNLSKRVATEAFGMGVKYGYTETIRHVGGEVPDLPKSKVMGFDLTSINQNKE